MAGSLGAREGAKVNGLLLRGLLLLLRGVSACVSVHTVSNNEFSCVLPSSLLLFMMGNMYLGMDPTNTNKKHPNKTKRAQFLAPHFIRTTPQPAGFSPWTGRPRAIMFV